VRQNKIKLPKGVPFAHTRAAAQVARATSTLEDGTAMGCPIDTPIEIPSGQTLPRRVYARGGASKKKERGYQGDGATIDL